MRKQLEKQHKDAVAAHKKLAAAYNKALQAQKAAGAKVRSLCDEASEAANVVAALKAAIDKLPKPAEKEKAA